MFVCYIYVYISLSFLCYLLSKRNIEICCKLFFGQFFMKRVRFETPTKPPHYSAMNDFECQSPRPFIEKKTIPIEPCAKYGFAEFNNDPLQKYETANSSPYPLINKTSLSEYSKAESKWSPSNDLELSMLDSGQQARTHNGLRESSISLHSTVVGAKDRNVISKSNVENLICHNRIKSNSRVLTSLENTPLNPPNLLTKHDDFFLRRDNIHKLYEQPIKSIDSQLKKICLDKENDPFVAKTKLMKQYSSKAMSEKGEMDNEESADHRVAVNNYCNCHHCNSTGGHSVPTKCTSEVFSQCSNPSTNLPSYNKYLCHQRQMSNSCGSCPCNVPVVCNKFYKKCTCSMDDSLVNNKRKVDTKTWALEKYEESKGTLDIEEHKTMKEKREPTVADLFKIIKLQNEQLQLLQDKVDKFISDSKPVAQNQPLPLETNYITEHMTVKSLDTECHKISIGVMTSFEMVRTSTIINKEIVKQNKQSEAQIQCNRSQISVKEMIQPENINFLDGIEPVIKNNFESEKNVSLCGSNILQLSKKLNKDKANDEKTLNELSLYNVQVDNVTTPLMSPEQSLYLDVRDYSDSDSECDQSNVGWTYYNKVMTHVNGMLHDSDMPSSASALYRNTRQKCMQMKIDKTNVSVIKRVKFGDDPIGIQQQLPSTDTSLKMNQLAAKYLKNGTLSVQQMLQKPTTAPIDMSLATRNYMEKHQLLQGLRSKSAPTVDIPRFLDITALKQQPKLL